MAAALLRGGQQSEDRRLHHHRQPGAAGRGICGEFSAPEARDCEIVDNVVFESGGGVYLVGPGEADSGRLTNCLIVSNIARRDGGGISVNWYADVRAANCTIADNWAMGDDGGDGSGGGVYSAWGAHVTIVDSILWYNNAGSGKQVTVGVGFDFNPAPSSAKIVFSDIQGGSDQTAVLVETGCTLERSNTLWANPLFVSGPLGDYYLSQTTAGQFMQSPCVDAGSSWAVDVGMDKYTTRADASIADVSDRHIVDMGYHYAITKGVVACNLCDLHFDGIIDLLDVVEISEHWLDWYDEPEGDLNEDGAVDMADAAILAACWFVQDTEPPMPAVAQWSMRPRAVAYTTSLEMAVEPAADAWWGDRVAYRFECVTNPMYSSGWPKATTRRRQIL